MKLKLFLTIFLLFSFVFTGCIDNKPTQKDCAEVGMVLKKVKRLNYRTGKYELREVCVKNGNIEGSY